MEKMCETEGCESPVRAKGLCSRHYFAAYDRERGRTNGGHHRPPLDGLVYKIRYTRPGGHSHTTYYSDPKLAQATAAKLRGSGQLAYFATYTFKEDLT